MTNSSRHSLRARRDRRPGIGLFIPSLGFAGAEGQLLQLAHSLDTERWRPVVFTFGDAESNSRIESIAIPARGLGRVTALRRLLVREDIRILQAYLVGAQVYGLLASATLPGIRLVAAVRSSVRGREIAGWKGKIGHSAVFGLHGLVDRYVFNAESAARAYDGILPARKVNVIFNGVDTDRFHPDPTAHERIRRELGLPEQCRIVGALANVNVYKGYDTFVRAAATVAASVPDVHFVAAGEYRNALGEQMEKLVHQLSLTERWHFAGPRSDADRLLPGFDLLCSASRTEGFSNSVAEAMASGVPCVVTNVGDSALIVGDTGLVARPNEPAALASAMMDLLREAPSDLRHRGERARQRVMTDFSVRRMVKSYEALYDSLLAPAAGPRSACRN